MSKLSLSVLQLNSYIKRIIDSEELLIGIELFGEVSNFKISGGNAYFDLKEEGASIPCTWFGASESFKNGEQVVLTGRLSFYVKLGKITFIASSVEALGKGALYERFLELKAKLEKEGLFAVDIKKQIPKFAKKIGVITSETGAVIHDILKVARRKNLFTDFVLYPVRVQGEGAEKEIAEALRWFSESDVDTVILARGGGSFEDLSAFNTEVVARAIFACKKPVISGVGHETDFSISDFAADLRAATPSVASEFAVFDWNAEKTKLESLVSAFIDMVDSKFDPENVSETVSNLYAAQQRFIKDKQTEVEIATLKVDKFNPLSILKRGFLVAEKAGHVVKSVKDVNVGDELILTAADGKIITEVRKHGKTGNI